ncbi:MAG TPA: dihydroorotate dehydrogenase electron transfer subunit [Gammaproteobacteria bacterium]|nr:dihydroorotate dehydrogenase electron transfer subunit [Gammaproteobacteria bacterium]
MEDWSIKSSFMRKPNLFDISVELQQIRTHAGNTHIFKMYAPDVAATAQPGQFVQIRCHELLPLRRPFSLLSADPGSGEIEILFKQVGEGTKHLANCEVGDYLQLLGPIGNGFHLDSNRPRAVLLGGGVGMPPILFLAKKLQQQGITTTLFLGSEIPFPFAVETSKHTLPGISRNVDGVCPQAQEAGIPSRLASLNNMAGCYPGYVTDLADDWLNQLTDEDKNQLCVYACGPTPMLNASATLADTHQLPSQLCVEEFMACGVGGCAGCVIETVTNNEIKMQRVCVDGPVFDGATILVNR